MGQALTLTTDLSAWREALTEACDRVLFGLTYADLEAGVATGEYLAAGRPESGWMVLQKRPVGARWALTILAMGGRGVRSFIADWARFLEDLARDQGCALVVIVGRPGWQKPLTALGFKVQDVVLVKEAGVA